MTVRKSKPKPKPAKAKAAAKAETSLALKLPDYWPGKVIVPRKTADLIPYARNARTHSKAQIDKLAGLMQEFGFTVPVLIRGEDGTIGAGHGRILAANKLGWDTVPTIEAHGWSDAKFRAYILADNRSAEDAGWDDEMLAAELADIAASDFDVSMTGFDDRELDKILSDTLQNGNEDNVPEKPDQEYTVSRPGDVWVMNDHRLMVGSCTDKATVSKLLGKVKPGLMVTDPPYGINYDPKWRDDAGIDRSNKKTSTGKVQNDGQADWSDAWALFPGSICYVWHASTHASTVEKSLAVKGFEIRSQIIWDKQSKVIGRGAYHYQHEPCWYAVKKARKADWRGGRDQSTVWSVPNAQSAGKNNDDDVKTNHGTQKPVELYRRSITNHTSEGHAVYDPFAGSGTIIIACEVTGRIGFGCEIDTGYADVIVERWQNLTGDIAVLEETGQKFEEVREARQSS